MAVFNQLGPHAQALFWDLISDPNLETLWVMNETGGGTIYDRCTKNGTNGTVNGNPAYSKAISNHFYGLDFDGTGDYVDFGNVSALNFERTAAFSAVAIINPNVSADNCIVSKHNGTSGWEFSMNASRNLVVQLTNTDTTNEIVVTSTSALTNGTATLVGFSYSGSSAASGVTLYVDESSYADADTTDNLAATIQTSGSVQVAARNSGAAFNGDIAMVAIFSAAFSGPDFQRWGWLGGFS